MKSKKREENKISRRTLMKKATLGAGFAVPTIVTFKVSKLHAEASVPPGPPEW